MATRTEIAKLYVATFNRAADADGLTYWISDGTPNTTSLTNLEDIAAAMIESAEYQAEYAGLDREATVTAMYQNLFNRAPDADGLTYWVSGEGSIVSIDKMIIALINGAQGDDVTIMDNKATVGLQFADAGLNDVTLAKTVMEGVTADPATVTAAEETIATYLPQTFTLTTGVDTLTGGAGDDTFNGVVSSLSSEATLGTTDVLDGAEGNDTFELNLKGNWSGLGTDGAIKNIETIALTNDTIIDRSFDAKNVTGVEKYTLTSDKSISLSNLEKAGIKIDVNNVQNNFTVAFNSDLDLTGVDDAVELTLNGVGAAKVLNADGTVAIAENDVKITMAKIEEITLATTTKESFVDMSATDATTITAKGDQALTISAVKDGVTTLNASDMTAAIKADLTGVTTAASITTINTGSGDDTVTLDAADLVANASINGGAGADTLKLSDSAAAGSTLQLAMAGVETINVTGVVTGQTLTFSARNVNDLSTIQLDASTTALGTTSLVNLGAADITLKEVGAVGNGTATQQVITLDNSGIATVNFEASVNNTYAAATGIALANNDEAVNDITLSNASNAVINVGDYVEYKTGTIDATKATALTLNVNSSKNSVTTPTEQSAFNGILTAAKATDVTINAQGLVALAATSDLTGAQVVTISADQAVDTSATTFEKAATVNLTGDKTTSAITTGTIGTNVAGTTVVGYDVNVTASGLKAGLTMSAIASQQNVKVTVDDVTGTVKMDALIGANVTLNASTLTKDIVGATSATSLTINSTTANTGTATVNVHDNADTVDIGAIGGTKAFKTVTVDASNNAKAVTIGAITASDSVDVKFAGNLDTSAVGAITAKAVTIDASNALKAVTIGGDDAVTATQDIVISDSLTYTAGLVGADDANGVEIATTAAATDTTITLNGNIGNDKFFITGGAATAAATITVKGDLDIGTNQIDVTSNSTVDGLKIDLSGLTGAGTTTISATGSANDDTIIAAKVATTITGGKGDDNITLGPGADTVVFQGGYLANGVDTINSFTAGGAAGHDTIKIAARDSTATTASGNNAVITTITTALSTAGNIWNISGVIDSAAVDVVELNLALDDDVTLSATSTYKDLFEALSSDAGEILSISIDNISDAFDLVVYQNGNAYIWNVFKSINLIAVVNNIAQGAFADGDFVIAAAEETIATYLPQTFTLTTGVDTLTGGAGDDTFNGVVSSLSSEATLGTTDVLDGAEGNDTLNLNLKGNWSGLGTDGAIKNIETIALTNDTTIDRSFDAKNVTGVEKYTLTSDKSISLSNLEKAGIKIDVNNVQNNFTVAFNSDLDLAGVDDAVELTLNGVGAAKVLNADGTVATAENDVKITMAKIEEITLATTTKESFVDMSATDATTITAKGDQALTISAVKDGVTTLNASDMTAAIKADLTSVTTAASITTINTGSGDDTVTLDAADVVANASINGGAGADTLKLSDSAAAGSTLQLAMAGVETINVTGVVTGQTLTFSARNVNDLSTIQLDASTTALGTTSLVNLGAADITLKEVGAVGNGTATQQVITLDNSGIATVNFEASVNNTYAAATGIALANNDEAVNDITLSNASNAVINVGDYVEYKTGTIDATKATALTLNVNSSKNSATTPTEQSAFNGILTAAKATDVTINAQGLVTLAATSDLTGAQVVTISADQAVDTSATTFEKAATVNLTGDKTTSAITTGTIGINVAGTSVVGYDVNVTASGLKAGLTMSAIASQQNVKVTIDDVTGTVKMDALIGANVTLNASTLTKDIVGATSATSLTINSTTANTGTATVNVHDNADTVDIGAIGGTKAFKTVTVDASNNAKAVTIGAITASDSVDVKFAGNLDTSAVGAITAKAVTIDASNALKAVTIGGDDAVTATQDIVISDSLTYTAGLVGADDANGVEIATTAAATDTTITLNGNIGNDKFFITGGAATAAATITVKGDLDIGTNQIDVTSNSTVDGSKIDLSGITGAGTTTISATGSANDDTIIAAKVATTITGGKGDDSITLGPGADTVVFQGGYLANGVDTINSFTAGGAAGHDTIKIAAGDSTATTASGNNAVITTITTALSTAGNIWNISGVIDSAAVDVVELNLALDDDVTLSATSTYKDLFEALSSDAGEILSISIDNISDAFDLVVYQNGNAYIWNVFKSINLIAVVNNIAQGAFADGDFVIA